MMRKTHTMQVVNNSRFWYPLFCRSFCDSLFFKLRLFFFLFFFIAVLVKAKILALEWHKQIPHKLVSRLLQTLLQPSLKYPCWSYAKPAVSHNCLLLMWPFKDVELKWVTEEFSTPQSGTGKKAQQYVLFRRGESTIMYVPCWKPALHFFQTTGSPILCSFLQGAHIRWFNNINESNTHTQKGNFHSFWILPSSPSSACIWDSTPNHFMLILAMCLLQKEVLRLIGTLCRSSSPSPALLQISNLSVTSMKKQNICRRY